MYKDNRIPAVWQECGFFLFYEAPMTIHSDLNSLSSSPRQKPKKRGGQAGNRNAYKHGFYSSAYTQTEKGELSLIANNSRQNNIKFFKVLIARTAERIKPSASNSLTFQENVIALHTLVIAISRLLGAVNGKRQYLNSVEMDNERGIVEFLERCGWSQEEIDRESYGSTKNKRGGQPANLNALKHGFYASHYRSEELQQMEDLNEDDVAEESALLQVLMKRVFIGLKDDVPLADFLRAIRVLSYADACYEKLNRGRNLAFGGNSLMDLMIEAVREVNIEQGIE